MNLQTVTEWVDLTGKTDLITGGVLGSEMASALVGLGAHLALLVRQTNLPDALSKRLSAGKGKYMAVYADVLKRDLLQDAAELVVLEYGRIDFLINAAGGNHPQATTSADHLFFNLPPEALRFVFDLNMLGTILPCQVIGKIMAAQGEGIILNLPSMAAFTPLTRVVAYAPARFDQQFYAMVGGVHGSRVQPKHPGERSRPRLLHR